MNYYSTQITNLIEELRRLPGIGSKSAQRLAFHIINMPEEHVHHLAQTLVTAREKIRYCKYCCTLTDSEVLNTSLANKVTVHLLRNIFFWMPTFTSSAGCTVACP